MKVFVSIMLLVTFTSCATVFSGKNYIVPIQSYPQGAKVTINDEEKGITPMEIELIANTSYVIKLDKDGYKQETTTLNSVINYNWLYLDVILTLNVGYLVDEETEDWRCFDQDTVGIVLIKE